MVCTWPPDSKEAELGSSQQEASPSAGKNTRIILVPCSPMEERPYRLRVRKITSGIGISGNHSLAFCF